MNYFTADWHLGHENIIKYCARPFASIKEMHKTIFDNYNERVEETDTVYFLGDLTMRYKKEKLEDIFNDLPGRKILILGNHDKLKVLDYIDSGFESVHTFLDIGKYVLVHDPAVACSKVETRPWLVGHVHGLFKQVKNVTNVGVDVWNFYPVSEKELANGSFV